MGKMINFSEETPETDSSIKLTLNTGHWDDEVAIVVSDITELTACYKAWTGWYRHPRGKIYKICKDKDGYLVHKPGGGTDAWGTGYSWRDVKSGYGLSGVRAYQSRCRNRC